MINILSYVGMSLQVEVCLWSLLGLVRTIFDATLFKVNANLKQVWQMSMPSGLSLPLQRALRTMISGIMLVQCFTVYIYLAAYIVLLYPVFLEERPILVLPWLLLAAIRKLLCELTSLAIGLGTCVLLGPARPACIKFVLIKVISIIPSFYMWMLVYSYYHVLKVASLFKPYPVALNSSELDDGLELAVRRRLTKSLLGEQQLRTTLIASLYNNERQSVANTGINRKREYLLRMSHGTDTSQEDSRDDTDILQPLSNTSNRIIPDTSNEDWFHSEVITHRDTDRILEQFVLMMLRVGAYLTREGVDSSAINAQMFKSGSITLECLAPRKDDCDSTPMLADDTDTPPLVGNSKGKTASYLRDYPHIFMKKSDFPSNISHSLASDDFIMGSSRKYVNQSQKNSSNVMSVDLISTDEDTTPHNNGPMNSGKLNSKETKEKKLQTKSSEKSVTFKEIILKAVVQGVPDRASSKFFNINIKKDESHKDGSLIENKNYEIQDSWSVQPHGDVNLKTENSANTSIITLDTETSTSDISVIIKPELQKDQRKSY